MTVAALVWRSLTPPAWYALLAFGVPALILLLAWAASAYSGRPMSELMRDPAEVAHLPAYSGFVSNTGGLLWAGATTLALATAALLARAGRRGETMGFFVILGLLSGALMADDVFMLHDRIFPHVLGLPEWLPVAFHAVLLLVLLAGFRRVYAEWNLFFLAMALSGFAASLGIDLLPEESLPGHYVIEDGFKLFGIVNWLAFTVQSCFRYLRAIEPA